MSGTAALEITVTASVVSFRNPLYAGVQVGLACPPPSTVAGMLAAAAGGWQVVDPALRFAMAFTAGGTGSDLETYHPLDATGKQSETIPRERDFLADVRLSVWLFDDLDLWSRRLRRPVWPLRLGRSQDLVDARASAVEVFDRPGMQRAAIVPAEDTEAGTLLRLPTAVGRDRSRTRWDSYRYDATGRAAAIARSGWSTVSGQAVVLLPDVHPAQLE